MILLKIKLTQGLLANRASDLGILILVAPGGPPVYTLLALMLLFGMGGHCLPVLGLEIATVHMALQNIVATLPMFFVNVRVWK